MMGDTYDSATDAEADREQQRQLLAALNAWDRAPRRDECGAWTIMGSRGSICTWGDGKTWVLYVRCRSGQHWTYTKGNLFFCQVTQDCYGEACLRLHQLPTPKQATTIREDLGIRKRMELAPSDLERRRGLMASLRSALGRANPATQVPSSLPDQTTKNLPEPILDAELAK
jgi:hypothetical protein